MEWHEPRTEVLTRYKMISMSFTQNSSLNVIPEELDLGEV